MGLKEEKSFFSVEQKIKELNILKKQTPFVKEIYFNLGLLESKRKNPVGAIKHFMRAIRLNPDYTEAVIAMAEAHVEIEEYDMAEMIYLKVLEKRPYDIEIYNKLGNLYLKTNNCKKAMMYFREILSFDENYQEGYLGLAKCFDKNGRIVEAKRYYKKYAEKTPLSKEKQIVIKRINELKLPKKLHKNENVSLKLIV